ncbi:MULTISPECIES: hypothetical protein [unclassified Beijerinckia]|uniref:hypothetical protein n=1 Tax=unclassified Beijerinckia TaxID=2638183 RepID=UPI00089D59D2|nr:MULTISPECIES: hypothetical protein [unclassified Beijerinckia]MDH7799944.1 hypothetical protein [Beijerinckia sp. GAS462]SED43460.1 hypothetical protein SAMN05443249_5362 [Beijerinckia sp. 28-YEA-48]
MNDSSQIQTLNGRTEPVFGSPALANEEQGIPHSADRPHGADALGLDNALSGVAELIAHKRAQGPLTIGIFGGSGSGKSFALNRLLAMVEQLRGGATAAGATSPFLSRITVARLDAGRADGNPVNALAASVYDALRKSSAGEQAGLADEIVASSLDPRAAARAATERLMELRRKLDAERQELHELSGRRARLAETVLYQTSGSRIDSYARSNRGSIESRLRAFGFDNNDPVATYKDLVRDVGERPGIVGRVSTFMHAMWAFRGQTKLLVYAVIFSALAWALGHAELNLPTWIKWIQGLGEQAQPVAAFVQKNASWLGSLRSLCNWLVLAMLALNVVRAFRFVAPIYRGVSHLSADMDARRHELDHLISNQTRLVDDLGSDADSQARRAEEAERRAVAQGARAGVAQDAASPFVKNSGSADADARAFLAGLATAPEERRPQRIVVAIDNLDAVAAPQALALLDDVTQALSHPVYATIASVDADVVGATPEARGRLSKLLQTPFNVGNAISRGYGAFVKGLLAPAGQAGPQLVANNNGLQALDAAVSVLDAPMRAGEANLLETLSVLAGSSPRRVLQFINLYKLARTRSTAFAPLALALAVECSGDAQLKQALHGGVAGKADDAEVAFDNAALASALKAVAMVNRHPVSVGQMREGMAIASAYSA